MTLLILAFVTLQRLGELALANRNTRALKSQGAFEIGAGHYPLIVGLHSAWLAGLWLLAWGRPVSLGWLGVFVVLQLFRVWVIASLGGRWTTRIVILPGAPLVRRGPYRFLNHPNYMVVAGEIAVLPLTFGLTAYALAFSALNAVVIWIRLRAETKALSESLPTR
jgi:methyltransferase